MELYEEKYQLRCEELIKQIGLDYSELNNYENFKDLLSDSEFKQVMLGKQRRKNKRYRAKGRIKEMIYLIQILSRPDMVSKYGTPKLVFGTATFNDKELTRKQRTRDKKLEIWLKSHLWCCLLNQDHGSKTEREHYHFIGVTSEDMERKNVKSKKGFEIYEFSNKDYKLGFEPTLCMFDTTDIAKGISYLLKLNNHSNKATAQKRTRFITGTKYELLKLVSGLQISVNHKRKSSKKIIKEILKNDTYDTLNKRSVSDKEISIEDFVYFLDGKKSISEL